MGCRLEDTGCWLQVMGYRCWFSLFDKLRVTVDFLESLFDKLRVTVDFLESLFDKL